MSLEYKKIEIMKLLKNHPYLSAYINQDNGNDFTFGYYYNEEQQAYVFFKNEERGMRQEYKKDSEEDALEYLHKYVLHRIDLKNKIENM